MYIYNDDDHYEDDHWEYQDNVSRRERPWKLRHRRRRGRVGNEWDGCFPPEPTRSPVGRDLGRPQKCFCEILVAQTLLVAAVFTILVRYRRGLLKL